jgi:inner membrane protein
MRRERSPGVKLLLTGLVAAILIVPLMMVYALVWDRQDQAQTAQGAIVEGWGGPQVIAGPVIAVPYRTTEQQTTEENGSNVTRTVTLDKTLYLSPESNRVTTVLDPEEKQKSIYKTVLFAAEVKGEARFALPRDLVRFGIPADQLQWDKAQVRLGVSDSRGLTDGGQLTVAGEALDLRPGSGPAATCGQGFFAFVAWDGTGELTVTYAYGLRGSRSISLVPRGGVTDWNVSSSWPSPSFHGSFLPARPEVKDSGFSAEYRIDKLALGQPPVSTEDYGPPQVDFSNGRYSLDPMIEPVAAVDGSGGISRAISVDLVEPVNLYSKVDRAVKYGFLFIGFTFLAFLLFDIVGGARVAAAEYLLTGAGLVLFFVLLLAFAEVIGFAYAYLVASGAIIGLLSAYSAAVLSSWKRARFMGALLVGLYALLYVLLNLEGLSLLIGSVLLFVALAGVMYATRRIDWSAVGRSEDAPNEGYTQPD